MKVRQRTWYGLGALLCAFFAPATAFAQDKLPNCATLLASLPPGHFYDGANYDAVRRGCTISWVENNAMRHLTWRYYADDFAAPTLEQGKNGQLVLTSQRPPHLLDIDQNGTHDLLVFTLIGSVNGDYDIFLTETDIRAFVHAGTVNGSYLARDLDGMLVAQGRSGARAYFRFFKITDQTVRPLYDIDPQDVCQVTNHQSDTPPPAALVDHYCAFHTEPDGPSRQGPLDEDDRIARVPTGTVFYCQLDTKSGRREVTLTYADGEMRYTYGAIDAAPELSLARASNGNERGITPQGEVWESLRNGAYTYMVSFTETNQIVNLARLRVFRDGQEAPVFEATCDPQMTYARGL